MVARITFRCEVYVEGEDLDEIRKTWEFMPIFCVDALEDYGADVIEFESAEDAETNKEINLYPTEEV